MTRRLKYAVDGCNNGIWGDEPNGIDDHVVVRVADFDRERGRVVLGDFPTVRAIPSSALANRLLVEGDLLIEKSGGGEHQPVGNVVLFDEDIPAVCSNFVARMPVSKNCDARYVAYVFRSLYTQGRNVPHIKQTSGIQNLDSQSYLNEKAWLPTRSEQQRIANFLDEQTARIDALIAGKERLYDLLIESLDAAIERAVLAEVEIEGQTAFKRVVKRIITGPFGSALHSSDYIDEGVPVINPTHISAGLIIPDPTISITEAMAESLSTYRLAEGELVVGRRGEMGRCAVVPPEGAGWLCGTGSLLVTVDEEKIMPAYAQLVISSRASREWLSLASVGSTMDNLNTEILGRLPGYFPSIDKQRQRLTLAHQSRLTHKRLMEHTSEHISRLREYRSSLISAAVTGQIDINNFQLEAA